MFSFANSFAPLIEFLPLSPFLQLHCLIVVDSNFQIKKREETKTKFERDSKIHTFSLPTPLFHSSSLHLEGCNQLYLDNNNNCYGEIEKKRNEMRQLPKETEE